MNEAGQEQFVRQLREGRYEAFERLVRQYEGVVFSVVYRILGDREAARDVAQEAFLRAYERRQTLDPGLSVGGWLCRVAANEAINRLKEKQRMLPLPEEPSLSGVQDPETKALSSERTRLVEEALMKLSPPYRTLVVLKHLQGWSYREIAESVGISEEVVKSRLFTARRLLRDVLQRKGLS